MNAWELESVLLTARWLVSRARASERGETTEKVIITAVFAALALTVATIITVKVTERARSIEFGDEAPVTAPSDEGGVLGQ